MATQVITDPMLLDSTGHGIIDGLEGIKNAVQPINIYVDIPITIPVNEWTTTVPHQYTWTNARITTECGVEVHFTEGAETVDMKYLEYDKILGGITFEIDKIPDKPVPLMIRIINASTTAVVDPIDAAMVATSAVPDTANVEQALENHESRISTAEEAVTEIEGTVASIDTDVKSRLKSVNGVYGDENGNVIVNETEFTRQIVTDDAQQSSGEFMFRTTGGDASLSDGPAMLVAIMGRSMHAGEIADSLGMEVNAVTRTATPNITAELDTETFIAYVETEGVYTILYTTEWNVDPALYGITITNTPEYGDRVTVEWDGITEPNMTVYSNHVVPPEIMAVIDRETFEGYVVASGTYTLTYTDSWSENPALYGVTVTNTPVNGDEIVITYVKSDRGTIYVSNPTKFVSTGWNLYDNSTGKKYARVKKYSSQYGFLIGGSFASLQFSETLNGSKTTITPASGYFAVPADGYVWVTGGDDTTYIMMTWSDWTEGYEGTFQTYTESVVDLTNIMSNFPGGLLQVGAVADEINFSMKRAISRIERLAYTNENLEYAKTSGRAYDADTNYIYIVKEIEDVYVISESGAYYACDHGNEFIVGGDMPVFIEALYGQNLVDKLRTDVVTKSQDIVNNLTSTATNKALSAAQGKALNDNLGQFTRFNASSRSEIQTNLLSSANALENRQTIVVGFYSSISDDALFRNGYVYAGNLYINYKVGSELVFSASLYGPFGENIDISYQNGTWYYGGTKELNSKITTLNYTGTVNSLQTSLASLASSMSVGDFHNIKYTAGETLSPFRNTDIYGGTFKRTGNNYWSVILEDPEGLPIYGTYRNGTWRWEELALNSKLTPIEVPVTWDDGVTAQNYTRLSVFGDAAVFNFSVTINTTGTGWNYIGLFSSAYAPRNDLYFMLYDSINDSSAAFIKCYIASSGRVLITGAHSNILVRGSCSWIVNH